MNQIRIPLAVVTAMAVAVATPSLALASDLTLQRIMMSTGGVAYVEYGADVDGAATLGLDVRLDQVDDVLKSLVVFDATGGVGGLELPGRDTTGAAFGDLPFGPDGLASPLDYLNSLRGVMLDVTGPRPMSGRLLRAEKVAQSVGDKTDATVERTRVTLMAADGLRQFILEDAEAVQVADPVLRGRIERALEVLRRDAGSTVRHITLKTSAGGSGPRSVHVGYVAGAPLWKTSYRLVLPAAGVDKARLQGWAVLENTTGVNWDGVQLALQYGNPVTFRQAIYSTYFVQRPEVPVEILGRLLPDVDTRAAAVSDEPPPPPPAPAPAAPATMMRMAKPMMAGAPAPMAQAAETTEASEGTEETLFVLPGKISLAAGHTASVPIIDHDMTAKRVGLVQAGRPHPLAAIRITNDGATSLPAGVLTLYDPGSAAAFAGDARLGGLPKGESRLLSFAEDLRTLAVWRNENATSIAAVTAAGGVLKLDERLRWTSQVVLTAPAGETRDLLVEIPRQSGSSLAADNATKPVEETASVWRFAVSLAAGESRTLAVSSERITRQQISLLQDDAVVARLLGRPGLSDAAMKGLRHLADLRTAKAARVAEVDRLKAQVATIVADEERTRQNLTAVPANDALHARLVRQLDTSEGRIDALQTAIQQAQQAVDQAQRDLVAGIGGFTL